MLFKSQYVLGFGDAWRDNESAGMETNLIQKLDLALTIQLSWGSEKAAIQRQTVGMVYMYYCITCFTLEGRMEEEELYVHMDACLQVCVCAERVKQSPIPNDPHPSQAAN